MISGKVSIVIPVFNTGHALRRCLNSLIGQSYPDVEIILVDDGSTDDSLSICREYEKLYKTVKVIHQKNSGVSCARNAGIDCASGKWLMFVDADDWVEPDYVEKMVALNENSRSVLVVCSFQEECGMSSKIYRLDDSCFQTELIFDEKHNGFNTVLCTTCNKLYYLDSIRERNIYFCRDMKFGEDFVFNAHYLPTVKTIRTVSVSFYHYDCSSGSSAVRKLYKNYDEYILNMDQALVQAMRAFGLHSDSADSFRKCFIGERWRYAFNVCIDSKISVTDKSDILCGWLKNMPDEMKMWDSIFYGDFQCFRKLFDSSDGLSSQKVKSTLKAMILQKKYHRFLLKIKQSVWKVWHK